MNSPHYGPQETAMRGTTWEQVLVWKMEVFTAQVVQMTCISRISNCPGESTSEGLPGDGSHCKIVM